MPELSIDRQELFSRCLAGNNMTQVEAAVAAGYKVGPSLAATASRLANKPEVAARIFELQAQEHAACAKYVSDTGPTCEALIERCMTAFQLSISQEKSGDALRALKLVGQLREYLHQHVQAQAELAKTKPTPEERAESAARTARLDKALEALGDFQANAKVNTADETRNDAQQGDAPKA